MAACGPGLREAELLAVSDVRLQVSAGADDVGEMDQQHEHAVGADGVDIRVDALRDGVYCGSDHQFLC